MQKYSCRGCGRSFNPLTGTLFGSRKIPLSEWVEFLLQLFEFHSVKTSARDNRNAESAGKYWLAKVFSALEGRQDGVVLAGRVWLDETFVKVDARDRQSKGGRGLRDSENPMDPINDVHDKLKRFLRSHGGYARRDLQGWLNLFWFIWSEPRNIYEKAARLIKMAISANKVIRYRDLYGKKD